MYWTNELVEYISLRKKLSDLLPKAFNQAASELIEKINAEFGEEVPATKEISDGVYTLKFYDLETYITVEDVLDSYKDKNLNAEDVNHETILEIVKNAIKDQIIT